MRHIQKHTFIHLTLYVFDLAQTPTCNNCFFYFLQGEEYEKQISCYMAADSTAKRETLQALPLGTISLT